VIERLRRWREGLRQRRSTNTAYRILVGVTGTVVLAGGILAIPYPGPGWAIVFIGLGILASEFAWAHHTLLFVKLRYDNFMGWFGRQALWVRGAGALLTVMVVLGTLWMLGALDTMSGWVGLDRPWLQSPIGIGS
jgi:uncharacterized protein (TIGR02611 family)